MDKGDAVHIHSGILLSHEKDKIMRFAATWMQLEIIILSEVSQKEKSHTIWYHLYVESKLWHKWTYLWNKNIHRHREQTYGCQGGREVGGGMYQKSGVSRCKLLYIEWMNKGLLYSTGTYIQYPVINRNGKEYKKEYIHMYNWVTLLYSRN